MKHVIRELTREFPGITFVRTHKGHWKICLPNGKVTFTSGTPSDRRALWNTRAKIKRQLQRTP